MSHIAPQKQVVPAQNLCAKFYQSIYFRHFAIIPDAGVPAGIWVYSHFASV
jgi:hypothetical protein